MKYKVSARKGIGELRDSVHKIEGKVFEFKKGFEITDKPRYEGEIAMIPVDEDWPKDAPMWIASGDLVEVE